MKIRATQGQARPSLAHELLTWYDRHGRELPWRVKGGKADPYRVWLSEIMLQQTTVATVKDYFLKFIARWPTVQDLAAADLDDVLRAWAGLGYYARARNLHACAKAVVSTHGGQFPQTTESLRSLPGIGPYTAGAIAAIAFDQPEAAVDGNVERVLSRYYAITTPLPESKASLRERAKALVPGQRPGDFAQALMDLGATICTPKSPACGRCPWQKGCKGLKQGLVAELPRKAPKKTLPTRYGASFVLQRADGAVLLRKRPPRGLLASMMEVPGTDWTVKKPISPLHAAPAPQQWRKILGQVDHTFTHFHLVLEVHVSQCTDEIVLPDRCRWVPRHDLEGEALPTVMRKVLALALDSNIRRASKRV